MTYSYMVAGLMFSVDTSDLFDIETLLPSYAGFRVVSEGHEELFRLNLRPDRMEIPPGAEEVENDCNDMGHTRLYRLSDGGYGLEIGYVDGGGSGIFTSDASFSRIAAGIAPDNPDSGLILSSMLRIAFAQAIIRRDGISIHSSAVVADGKAWLFLGKSGTGKSTHSRMWLRNIPGAHLLNDDNPAVRMIDGRPYAFGTPWSGKTPCYRCESAPVGGIVRLAQGDADIFMRKNEVDAFVTVLPSCSVIHGDMSLQSRLCDTIAELVGLVPVGELECLPDNESAIICYNNLKSLIK